MIKLVTVVDPHMDTVAPRSRRDDVFETQRRKWAEVRQICSDLPATALVVTGDWFHKKDSHRVNYALTNWMIDFFKKFPCPVYGAMGNHDIKATPANWRKQPIGTLVESGAIQPLWVDQSAQNPTGFKYYLIEGDFCVQLSGTIYSYDIDKDGHRALWYGVPTTDVEPLSAMRIHTVHGSLVPVGHHAPYEHTTPDQLGAVLEPQYIPDLYIAGHEHDDLGSFAGPGFRVVNFGNLTRGSIAEYNLHRKVKVGVISITGDITQPSCKIESIALQSMRPASEVFYVEELEKERLKNEQITQFVSHLQAGIRDEFRVLDPIETLQVVCQAHQVTSEVEGRVRDYVDEARVELGE